MVNINAFFGINLALRATRRGPPPGGSGEEGKSAQAADGRRDKAKSKRAEQAVRTRRHSIIYGPPQEDRFGTVPCVSRGQAGDNAGGLVPDMSL